MWVESMSCATEGGYIGSYPQDVANIGWRLALCVGRIRCGVTVGPKGSVPVLLGISGSLRADATNRKLIREAARHYGGSFVEGDIRLPLYDGDDEKAQGVPGGVALLAAQIASAEAIVISTPEYNQSLSGSLKNALDWISRVEGSPWRGKPVALMSAAAGRSGGARANYALRLAMTPFRARLLSMEVLVAGARKEFGEDGRLLSERIDGQVGELMAALRAEVSRG